MITFALDANDPSTQVEARWWMNEIAQTSAFPVQIDPVNDGQGVGHDSAQYGAVYPILGALYTVSFAINGVGAKATIFKSSDSGATWAAHDAANGPTHPVAQCFDGVHTITLAWSNAAATSYQFQDFDASTGLWGVPYGAGSPAGLKVSAAFLFKRTDGSLLFCTSAGAGTAANVTPMVAASWSSGGGWSATFDPGGNIAALPGFPGTLVFIAANRIMSFQDAAGRVGLICFLVSFNVPWNARVFFQQINLDNSLGSFSEWANAATVLGNPGLGGGPPFGVPVVLAAADTIVVPVTAVQAPPNAGLVYATVYTGSPIAAPVWSIMAGQGIDPGSKVIDGGDGSLTPESFSAAASDGVTVYCAWMCTDSTQLVSLARVRLAHTSALTPTAGWACSTLFDMTVSAIPPGFYPSPVPPAPNNQQLFNPTLFGSAATPATAPPLFAIGGSASRFYCCPPRKGSQAFEALRQLQERAKAKRDCAWPYVHEFPSPASIERNLIGAAACPAKGATVTPLTFHVPEGMRFYLESILFDDFGSLTVAAGDVLWTLQQNGAAVQGVTGIPIPLGSISKGRWWPIERAYEFAQLTQVSVVVLNVNLAGGSPIDFIACLGGYLLPER